jgi:hypothetical protein
MTAARLLAGFALPVALVCLPPHGNVSHVVRARPAPASNGRTWCGRSLWATPKLWIAEWEPGPDLDAHLARRRPCRCCVTALREANRPPPPPVARIAVAAVAIRCPHCFAPQYRSARARAEGDDTWPLDYFSTVRWRVCPECKAAMLLPGDAVAEATKQAGEGQ